MTDIKHIYITPVASVYICLLFLKALYKTGPRMTNTNHGREGQDSSLVVSLHQKIGGGKHAHYLRCLLRAFCILSFSFSWGVSLGCGMHQHWLAAHCFIQNNLWNHNSSKHNNTFANKKDTWILEPSSLSSLNFGHDFFNTIWKEVRKVWI